jgi:WD40 repeat protein
LREVDDGISLDAAFSPDGHWLVVPRHQQRADGYHSVLEVWDVAARKLEAVKPSPAGALTTAAFTADGSQLITHGGFSGRGESKDEVVVWNTRTWRPVGATWELSPAYAGDNGFVVSAAAGLAAAPHFAEPDGPLSIGVWRLADRTPVGAPIAADAITNKTTGALTGLAIAPDGSALAVSTELGGVLLVDPLSHEVDGEPLAVPESTATAVAFSPDGRTIAVGRLDGRTQLYDRATREPLGPPLAASAAEITDISFAPDGSRLVTESSDRTAAVWRLDGDRSIGVGLADERAPVTEAAFTIDGAHLLTADLHGAIAVRNARSGRLEDTIKVGSPALSVALDSGSRRIAAAGAAGKVVLVDLDGEHRQQVDVSGVPNQVTFAPDGSTVAVAVDASGGDEVATGPGTGAIRFLDAATGKAARSAIDIPESPVGLGYTRDGALLAIITSNNQVHFFSPQSGQEVGEPIENPDAAFTSLAFSPDGQRIVLGVASGALRQYDLTTRQPVAKPLEGDPNGIYGVAYSPDGKLVAGTTLGFSTTRLWDAQTGAPLGAVLTGGRVPYSFKTFTVEMLMYSRPAFSPDGRTLATPGFGGATVIWSLDADSWSRAACAIAGRDLTDEEWQRYLPGRAKHQVCD